MTSRRPVHLSWSGHGESFRGAGASGRPITIDGEGREGPSPTETLLLSLAGCMAIDVKTILDKGRVPLTGLDVRVEAERAEDPPRRFTAARLVFRLEGPTKAHSAKIRRAVDLSRDKYCSVLHTLRPDLHLAFDTEITRG